MESSKSTQFALELRDVGLRLPDGRVLLDDVNLNIPHGELFILIGRSGSGKTTLLKSVNGLLSPTSGQIRVLGKNLVEWDPIRLRRNIGYVIQETGLFPHFTIADNVGLVPRLLKWDDAKIELRTNELLKLVGLDPETFATRFPRQLSGGQRQRVGVARALAADPPLMLMDEPFGALDPLTRTDLQLEFRSLHARLNKSVLFVTHDIREALVLGGRIGFMDGGKLQCVLSPKEFLESDEPELKAYRRALDPVAVR